MIIRGKDGNISTIIITEELYNYYQSIEKKYQTMEYYLKGTQEERDSYKNVLQQISSYHSDVENDEILKIKEMAHDILVEFSYEF